VVLGQVVPRKKIALKDLSGKAIAVDAYNAMYQFLAIIRGVAGQPLMDARGNVTSHLSGLLYRTANLAEQGVKLLYVFDGKPPTLKESELKRRMKVKEEATIKYEEAIRVGAFREAKQYAQMTASLKNEMVEDAKRLLDAMGVPWVQAPSEGEAQAAYIAARGDVWAAASQDYDSLLFGAPRLVRNLTISGRRKLPRREAYVELEPELVELHHTLTELKLTREQLVDLGILVGTDFNPSGIEGIGPRKALKLLKEHGNLQGVMRSLEKAENREDISAIRRIFLEPNVSRDYKLEWRRPSLDKVVRFLCADRDFSEERVKNAIERMISGVRREAEKTTLDVFLG